MFYDSWEHILIPTFGMISIFAWFYLEKYRDKSAEDWLHTNKRMAHEVLYVLSWYGTAISAAFGFIGYGLITWVGWGGFAVFDLSPFVEFQFAVLTSTLIWSLIRQEYTHALFDKVVRELPYIMEDEDTAAQARRIIAKLQGEMANLDEIVKEVQKELESKSKERKKHEKELNEQQRTLKMIQQEIEQHDEMIRQTISANKDIEQSINETKRKNKGLKTALDENMQEFHELQAMRMILIEHSEKLQDDVDTVNLEIQDAFREIEQNWAKEQQEFDNLYPAVNANQRKLRRYMNEEPQLKKKNEYLKELLEKQLTELPKASRSEFELKVREFKRKALRDYLICDLCKQPKKAGCTCGGSGPMYLT